MGGKETIKKKLQNAYSNCLSEALTSWSQTWRSLRWLPWSDELGEGVAEVHFPSHADFALIFPFLHFLASAVIAYIKNFTDYNCYNERGMIYNPIMACNALTRKKKNEGKKKKKREKRCQSNVQVLHDKLRWNWKPLQPSNSEHELPTEAYPVEQRTKKRWHWSATGYSLKAQQVKSWHPNLDFMLGCMCQPVEPL